jgi:hypothetical protein
MAYLPGTRNVKRVVATEKPPRTVEQLMRLIHEKSDDYYDMEYPVFNDYHYNQLLAELKLVAPDHSLLETYKPSPAPPTTATPAPPTTATPAPPTTATPGPSAPPSSPITTQPASYPPPWWEYPQYRTT